MQVNNVSDQVLYSSTRLLVSYHLEVPYIAWPYAIQRFSSVGIKFGRMPPLLIVRLHHGMLIGDRQPNY